MFRFYLMPYLLGYSVMGMLSFPLESEIAGEIYRLFGKNYFKKKTKNDTSNLVLNEKNTNIPLDSIC